MSTGFWGWVADLVYAYDTILIGVFFVFNIVIIVIFRILYDKAKKTLRPTANVKYNIKADMDMEAKKINSLETSKKRLMICYASYANITAIFPLLGILGTVSALVKMDIDADLMQNLSVALVTTLAGVVCAIFFKLFDAALSGPIDNFIDDVNRVVQKYQMEEDKEHEA